MGLYSLGKSAAIATIKAAINARVKTLSDDTLALDWLELQKWIGEQALLILSQDVSAENRDAAQGVMNAIDPENDSRTLANVFPRARWEGHPDWPTTGKISNSAGFLQGALQAIAKADQVGDSLDTHYAGLYDKVAQLVQDSYEELKLEDRLPALRERITQRIYYLYTYVTDWGEESAPSPVSVGLDVDQDDEVDITIESYPPGRHIAEWRFYTSAVGSNGAAFQFLGNGAAAITSATVNPRAILGEVCPTITWAEPPANLRGLTGMPNGVMAGHFDNVVCFCEPYVHYAWPVEYQMTVSTPVVAMAAFGQTLVVAHYAGVDYVSGADSASMSMQKDVSKQSCASPRSMVPVDGGVVYASPDGLCLANSQGVQLITGALFSREDWLALAPDKMIGAYHEGTYYFTSPGNVIYSLHLTSGKLTTIPGYASAFFQDPITDSLYAAIDQIVIAVFGGPERREGVWRSKLIVLPKQEPFAWLVVESDFSAPVKVNWYGDGVLRHSVELTSRAPVRLPPGRYLEHEIELVSKATLNAVTIASSTQELQST